MKKPLDASIALIMTRIVQSLFSEIDFISIGLKVHHLAKYNGTGSLISRVAFARGRHYILLVDLSVSMYSDTKHYT